MEIDLTNTWCIANVPNHDKLRLLGYNPKPVGSHRCGDYYYMLNRYEIYDSSGNIFNIDFKQVELNEDNEFVYVNEKEDNSFTKYGFEVPEFECEILKYFEDDNTLVGYYKVLDGTVYAESWHSLNGRADNRENKYNMNVDLTPIKKPWYETCKFPCVIMADYCMPVVVKHYDDGYVYDFRDNKYCVKSWRLLRNTEIEGLKQ